MNLAVTIPLPESGNKSDVSCGMKTVQNSQIVSDWNTGNKGLSSVIFRIFLCSTQSSDFIIFAHPCELEKIDESKTQSHFYFDPL